MRLAAVAVLAMLCGSWSLSTPLPADMFVPFPPAGCVPSIPCPDLHPCARPTAPAPLRQTCTPAPDLQAAPWLRLTARVTAYSPHDAIDAAYRATKGERWRWITADGRTDVREAPYGVAAAQRALPFGARVRVPGYHRGQTVEVDDTGGGMRQSWRQGTLHLDVRFRTASSSGAWRTRMAVIEVDPQSITPEQARALARFVAP